MAGYGSQYFSPKGRCFARVQPTEEPVGFPRRNAFRQPILEAQLRHALARFPHVTVAFEHELVSFEQDLDEVRLTIRHAGAERRVASDYLIACDGASSSIRRGLGIGMSGSTFRERWLIVGLENSPVLSPHQGIPQSEAPVHRPPRAAADAPVRVHAARRRARRGHARA